MRNSDMRIPRRHSSSIPVVHPAMQEPRAALYATAIPPGQRRGALTLDRHSARQLVMLGLLEADCREPAAFLAEQLPSPPRAAVVLGSGLGGFLQAVEPLRSIPYSEIPGIPRSTAVGHAGMLHAVEILETPTVILQGRCHRYEGYSRTEVTRLIRTLCFLGIETLIVSCAAGGLNPRFRTGDLMLFDSHLDFLGVDRETLQQTYPGASWAAVPDLYAPNGLTEIQRIAREELVSLQQGTYVGVRGPNYETRAELRFYRQIGGDAIGMSSIPELLAAHQLGVRAIGLATITNECRPDAPDIADAQHVLQAAQSAEPRFRRLVLSLLARLTSTATAPAGGHAPMTGTESAPTQNNRS